MNKAFSDTAKLFMINKCIVTNNNIVTEVEENEESNVEKFNKRCINIAENKSGIISKQIRNSSNPDLDTKIVNEIIKNFENHSNIAKIKRNFKKITFFDFLQASTKVINRIIKSRNLKKPAGSDGTHKSNL